jgi:hypothetical protein
LGASPPLEKIPQQAKEIRLSVSTGIYGEKWPSDNALIRAEIITAADFDAAKLGMKQVRSKAEKAKKGEYGLNGLEIC